MRGDNIMKYGRTLIIDEYENRQELLTKMAQRNQHK